jgi:Fic family protein
VSAYQPPFELTPPILGSVAKIERLLGRLEGLQSPRPTPQLRRNLTVRTVRATLAIEGAMIDEDQVTALLEGKRVVGRPENIRAAHNAIKAYEGARRYHAERESDFLAAHAVLMKGLVNDAGRYRRGNVGVLAGSKVAHVAPQPARVPALIGDLLGFLRDDDRTHPIVKSAIVHYEIEFIHPFTDGNGRMGRLWQHVVLTRFDGAFAYVPVETIVRERQADYYAALSAADRAGSATPFIEFSLATVHAGLMELMNELRPRRPTAAERIELARARLGRRTFSRQEYIAVVAPVSTATASRDLASAVEAGLAERRGATATARYRFTRGKR